MLTILYESYNLDDVSHCLIESRVIQVWKNWQP